jgi:hypothetical protein
MNVDIFVVSCAKHFPWLQYALQSMVKFATGFRQVLIMIPEEDLPALNPWFGKLQSPNLPIRAKVYDDWPGKGFLRHEDIIMRSDKFTDADFICHMDSDTLFCEPVSPDDYFINGKPVLMYATYHWLVTTQQANLGMWQTAVQKAVGGPVLNEFMRRHPAVHARHVYGQARMCIGGHTGMSASRYIQSCREEFPTGFAEFNTLGEVAWRYFHEDYHWWNQETEGFIKPNKVVQFWSKSPPEIPQKPVFKDQPFECTPESLLKIL